MTPFRQDPPATTDALTREVVFISGDLRGIDSLLAGAAGLDATLATVFSGGGNGVSSNRAAITSVNPATEGGSEQSIVNLLFGAK